MANFHLVILKEPYLEAILSGQKTIESRFSRTRRGPFGQVRPGDKLFLKVISGSVRAIGAVLAVKKFENLTPKRIVELKKRYNRQICGSEEYWQSKADCKFGVLVWLEKVKAIKPVRIDKSDWRAWVVLTRREDFGLLKIEGLMGQ
jgi:ASC-1-like (ASCH) protein